MKRSISLGAAVCVAAVAALGASPTSGSAQSVPNPANFVQTVDNPWFPLHRGATYVFTGVKDGKPTRDVVRVTTQTKLIQGVRCTAVSDRLYASGALAEGTTDWYAQDRAGTVWYFGEATAELDAKGNVTTTEGSWQAGVGGARAGVFMPARPRVGQRFRQEYLKGQAEDHFEVLSLEASVTTPAVSSKRALLTREWTPLEPGVLDHKLYVRGIGVVDGKTIRGGDEHNVLVSYSG